MDQILFGNGFQQNIILPLFFPCGKPGEATVRPFRWVRKIMYCDPDILCDALMQDNSDAGRHVPGNSAKTRRHGFSPAEPSIDAGDEVQNVADIAESGTVSIICPAHNECATIERICTETLALNLSIEMLVIDDGSTDDTAELARAAGATVIQHESPQGNGAAVKTGLRHARGEFVVIVDGDGQHNPAAIPLLLDSLRDGADLVVASRPSYNGSGIFRSIGNRLLSTLASRIVGTQIPDLTSGFRAFRRQQMLPFVPLLPEGFSTPTTSTIAFLNAGHDVRFESVAARKREAGYKTRTHLLRDGVRFLTILTRITRMRS